MNQLLIVIATLLSQAAADPRPDQSADAATVAGFLAAVERGDREAARALLTSDVYVGDYMQWRRTGLDAFYAYARECRLSAIRLVATDRRLPVGVTWRCTSPGKDREASFWIEGDKINRIGWGPPVAIEVPPLSATPRPIAPR